MRITPFDRDEAKENSGGRFGKINSNTTNHKPEHSSIVIERRKCRSRHCKAASALKLLARITVNTAGRDLERCNFTEVSGNL